MNQTAVAEAAHALTETFDLPEQYESAVPLSALIESGHNARRKFDQQKLEELGASIREKGIIEPLVVRPFAMNGSVHYEIVAGARRFRASMLAGRTHVPCVIREYSDSDVLELQIIENIQREELDPLEEATGYATLIQSNPSRYSAAFIADRIGRSEKYVWDTMRLLNLVPEAKEHLDAGRITRSHAVVLARLTPQRQAQVIKGGLFTQDHSRLDFEKDTKPAPFDKVKAVSVRELEQYVAEHVRFDPAHMATTAPLEFGDTAKQIEAREEQPGRGKKVIPITFAYHLAQDARDSAGERTYGVNSWVRADGQEKSKTCEHSVLGVVVAGVEQYGKTFEVCIARDKCKVHFGKVIAQKEKNAKLRDTGQSKRAASNEKRQQQTWQEQQRKQQEERERWDRLRPHAVAAAAAKVKTSKLTDRVLQHVIGLLLNGQDDQRQLITLLGGPVTAKTFTRALAILNILENDWSAERFKPVAKKYRIDLAKLAKTLPTAKETK